MKSNKKVIFCVIAILGFLADIGTKHVVFEHFNVSIISSEEEAPENKVELAPGVYVPRGYRPKEVMHSWFTFSTSSEYVDGLERRSISKGLQNVFKENGHIFTKYTTLQRISSTEWIIEDRGRGKRYFLTAKEKTLKIVPSFFCLCVVLNRGAVWGVMQKKTIFLTLITLAAIVFIVFLVFKKEESEAYLIPLSLITAGALGNLWDRVLFSGVRDFLDFHLGFMHWPTFNIADVCIVIGVTLYFIIELRHGLAKKEAPKDPPQETQASA